jgi:hypothetical protein
MVPSHFPLRDGLSWVYSVTDPITCRLITVRLLPPGEIEVADMLTGETRPEQAWFLEETERSKQQFLLEREGGVQFLRERRFGRPERTGIVVTDDLRWAGEETWSHPGWHYSLETIRYRRAGEEEVIVTAGAFRCVKILVDEGERGTYWLAPGVGIIRSVGAIEGLAPTRYSVVELYYSGLALTPELSLRPGPVPPQNR